MVTRFYVQEITYMYIEVVADDHFRHVMNILDKDLNLIHKKILSKNISTDLHFNTGRSTYDGKNIYVAGSDWENGRWVIYSISVKVPEILMMQYYV